MEGHRETETDPSSGGGRATGPPVPATLDPRGLAQRIRKLVIEESYRAHVGHIGSSLSIADILAALFAGPLLQTSSEDPDRHRLILSKGHAALALYAALHSTGRIPREDLSTFCGELTQLGAHPEHALAGVDFSTGSLGQGLSIATGAALAARLQASSRTTYVVMSDAELNEGSVWEATMFAAHHRLANLVAIVDVNGQQAFGHTRDVLDLDPLGERWRAFGWDVHELDGHDVGAIATTLDALEQDAGPPHVLLATTIFGKGVSYMEGQIKWHYLPMSDSEYESALSELEQAPG